MKLSVCLVVVLESLHKAQLPQIQVVAQDSEKQHQTLFDV
jgi:hypothetical protein